MSSSYVHRHRDVARQTEPGVLRVSGTRVEASATDGIRTSSGDVTVRSSVVTRNKGIGIVSQSGPLIVDACTVSENLGGGISSTNGSFNITNNAVVHNGDPGVTGFGGLRLDSSEPVNRFQHNTVIRNDCDVNFMPVLAGGVYCVGAIASNNLIANNFRGNTSLANAQTGGSCDFGNSIISQTDATLGLAADGVHLTATSSAVNAGSASAVTTDIDGAARSDGMPDIGADEFQP